MVVVSFGVFVPPLDLLSPCPDDVPLFVPPLVLLPPALSVDGSVGAAGRFIIDSVPGAAGIGGLSVFPVPDPVPIEGTVLPGAELPGANVLGGPDVDDEAFDGEDVEPGVVDDAPGVDVVVCIVGAGIMVDTAVTAKSEPVHGSIGTFITMVRGVR